MTAGLRGRLPQLDRVAAAGKKDGRAQTRDAGADDEHDKLRIARR